MRIAFQGKTGPVVLRLWLFRCVLLRPKKMLDYEVLPVDMLGHEVPTLGLRGPAPPLAQRSKPLPPEKKEENLVGAGEALFLTSQLCRYFHALPQRHNSQKPCWTCENLVRFGLKVLQSMDEIRHVDSHGWSSQKATPSALQGRKQRSKDI